MITLEKIKEAGFEDSKEIFKDIFYVKNFLSPEEVSLFGKVLKELPDSEWSLVNHDLHESWHNKFYDHNNDQIKMLVQGKIDKIISSIPSLKIVGYTRVLRQTPGNGMEAHVDERHDIRDGAVREFAAVVYINGDYKGGELHYVNLGVEVKPEAGSLMLFKTGDEYLHEVKPVTGTVSRYCLPAFIFSGWKDPK